jgi:hypothetical protein
MTAVRTPPPRPARRASVPAQRGAAEPVMAVVRVKAPAEVDPHVLQAELTRAVAFDSARPVTAEMVLLPAWRRRKESEVRRHGFVAVLRAPTGTDPDELTAAAQKAMRKSLRRRFGATTSVKVRPPRTGEEIDAFWCSVRGTPHRP